MLLRANLVGEYSLVPKSSAWRLCTDQPPQSLTIPFREDAFGCICWALQYQAVPSMHFLLKASVIVKILRFCFPLGHS